MRRPAVIVEADYDAMSRRAASLVDDAVRRQPQSVLALPTGATPIGMYDWLARLHVETQTDWSKVTTFNLDEYAGVAPDDPESYAFFMQRYLFSRVNLRPDRCNLPRGLAGDPAAEVERYEASIERAGGLDLAVLGVGINGHVGFNEPGAALIAETHLAELSEETWRRNFPHLAELPEYDTRRQRCRRAFTMGMGSILQARRVLVLASAEEKRAALQQALAGPVTAQNPASFLQLHRDVTLVLDAAAADGLA